MVVAPAPAATLRADRGTVSGRVLLDGEPVHYFGVAGHPFGGTLTRPIPFHTRDGRFLLTFEEGEWELIVVGPGFARKVVLGMLVTPGATIDLGEVRVFRGFTIQGRVTDDSGKGVDGATVSLVQGAASGDRDLLAALAVGNLTTTTFVDGSYVLEGFAATDIASHARISATTSDGRISLELDVANGNATIDLVVTERGELVIEVAGPHNKNTHVMARSVAVRSAIYFPRLAPSGNYEISNLPMGDYDVFIFGSGGPTASVRVTVSPGPPAWASLTP
jgi:hypothetical protein